MRRTTLPALLAASLLALGAVACSEDAGDPPPDPTPSATAEETPEDEPTEAGSSAPAALEWRKVPGSAEATVTVSGEWRLTQREDAAVLTGPERREVTAPAGRRVSQALIDGEYAVVVTEHEQATEPDQAVVVDLASGEELLVDGASEVPTTVGGTWALGQGRLLHATLEGRAYCLASVELASGSSEVVWCAPRRSGFADARITPAGTSLLTFDDSQPSCRTVGRVTDGDVVPFDGVPECTGWDGLVLDEETSVWSVAAKANRVEEATFHAASGGAAEDLGPGTSGSLTWCGGAAYFVRDPQRSSEPARLLAWRPGAGLTTAYKTEATGRAFLGEPRCGGDHLTVSAFTEQGDVQVTAEVA